ncbi:hypothetical protein F8A86_04520 [Betaproteobacteria bacterium SCN1]|jgi:hypothetical protein|nr:hypothetical protein F8A86_04520 [Betaproteobacteria bacterium SCN1]MBN8759488.1 hypothetical protein [Thiobacillus sp.]
MKRTLLLPLNMATMLLLLQFAVPAHAAKAPTPPAAPAVETAVVAPQPILIAWDRVGATA